MLNLYRNYPFENKKLLPIIDFNIIVPASVSRLYIKKVDPDGIYIYSDDDSMSFTARDIHQKNKTIYIYDSYEDIVGTLLTSEYIPYPIEFELEDTLLLNSVVYRENIAGIRRVFVYKDKKYIKLKKNIVITAGNNIIINSDGSYHAYTDVLMGGYLKSINNTITTKHATIFGQNIIMVNGDEFSTTIEDPNLICPVAFKPGSIGDQGSPGDAGTDGKDGEVVYDFFTNPELCNPDCSCYETSVDCIDHFSEEVCDVPEPECDNCDSDLEVSGIGDDCSVCDGCDSEAEDVDSPLDETCSLDYYEDGEDFESFTEEEIIIPALSKISDGKFKYLHWDSEYEEEFIEVLLDEGTILEDDTVYVHISNVFLDDGPFEFCCLKCLNALSDYAYDGIRLYILKPSKNCTDPFSYYCDGEGNPITFYSTWEIDNSNLITKKVYVMWEDGTTKGVELPQEEAAYSPGYIINDEFFGYPLLERATGFSWEGTGCSLVKTIEGVNFLWTLSIDSYIYTLTTLSPSGEGTYDIQGEPGDAPTTVSVIKDGSPEEYEYNTDWSIHILWPNTLRKRKAKGFNQATLFKNKICKDNIFYISGEEFSLICGTTTHIPNFINSNFDSSHIFITPFEGPCKEIEKESSHITIYDAMIVPSEWVEFPEWQTPNGD